MIIKKGNIYELEVHEMAYGGKGISKVETENGEFVVFIPNSIPGQLIKTRIIKKKARYAEGRALLTLKKSPLEINIPYQAVSGAPYATLPLEKQRFFKERDSLDQFRRQVAPEVAEKFTDFITSPDDWFYRNKMEYSFSAILWDKDNDESVDEFGLGFKKRGMWWAAENLNEPSGLFDEEFEKGISSIKEYCESTGLPPWHAPRREGFFRSLLVRKSFLQDKFLIALMTSSTGLEQFDMDEFVALLHKLYPGRIASIYHTLSDSEGDRFEYSDEANKVVWGEDQLEEELLGLRFKISLGSFFQTNPASAERLYKRVLDHVNEYSANEGVIMDLFCGTGTIAQLMAKHMPDREIIGVDIAESSIRDAQKNAALNEVNNAKFFSSDVGKFLKAHPEYEGQIETIILDPPRNGVEGKSLQKVIDLQAKNIIYVSCNPATQARDAQKLIEDGYEVQSYCLVDQFPHTSHIEGIAVFTKK
jgi:23S rRNA (uracil1939-C5)-methyltransferase